MTWVALGIAVAALVAGVALWADGRVVIGLELREGTDEEDGRPGSSSRGSCPTATRRVE